MSNQPLVINLFAAPGTGKSTMCAGLFYELKSAGINAEMCREYAKDLVWGNRLTTLNDQIYLFGKQHHRMFILQEDVDVIITDCPLPMNLIYSGDRYPECFQDTVIWAFNQYNNYNVLLNRVKKYNPKGRTQTEEESDAKQKEILTVLSKYNIPYYESTGDKAGLAEVLADVMKLMGR
jgi:hypothetical protein